MTGQPKIDVESDDCALAGQNGVCSDFSCWVSFDDAPGEEISCTIAAE